MLPSASIKLVGTRTWCSSPLAAEYIDTELTVDGSRGTPSGGAFGCAADAFVFADRSGFGADGVRELSPPFSVNFTFVSAGRSSMGRYEAAGHGVVSDVDAL